VVDDLTDYLVVDTDDVLLICHRDNEAVFKRYVNDAAIKYGNEFV
jgi:mannose-1-phosphate guanylyltransferase